MDTKFKSLLQIKIEWYLGSAKSATHNNPSTGQRMYNETRYGMSGRAPSIDSSPLQSPVWLYCPELLECKVMRVDWLGLTVSVTGNITMDKRDIM